MAIRRNLYFIIVIGLVLVSSSCIRFMRCQPSDREIKQLTSQFDSTYSMRFRRAYYQGMQEAKQEINDLKMTIYVAGLIPTQLDTIDKETGLPRKIIAGCIINDSIDGLMLGHNDGIMKYLESDELMRATRHLNPNTNKKYRKAYYRGMHEAYQEIKDNKLTIYVWGEGLIERIDKETGLPIKIISKSGVKEEIVGRADGHNYVIHKFLKGEIR